MPRIQHLGKGVIMHIPLAPQKEVTVTEAAFEVGGEGVFSRRHRLIEGLLTEGIFQRNYGGIGGADLLLNARILRVRGPTEHQQET
jgi:hypothetical protein